MSKIILAVVCLALLAGCGLTDTDGTKLVRADSCKIADVVHDYGFGSYSGGKWCYKRVVDAGAFIPAK